MAIFIDIEIWVETKSLIYGHNHIILYVYL